MDRCSFCGKTRKETKLLVAGLEGYICDNCIEQAHNILVEETASKANKAFDTVNLLKPSEIKNFLSTNMLLVRIWQKR